ncbi:MAG: hypothetical protein ICV73_30375 [Acetobacteraceae bacterium]|nr:hypothetical protein [Acetobacteraceae bacterium]
MRAAGAPDQLLEAALAQAEDIAAGPSDAVWMAKRRLQQNALEQDLRRVVTAEGLAIRALRRLPGDREAIVPFVAKREPNFHPGERAPPRRPPICGWRRPSRRERGPPPSQRDETIS